MRKQRTEDSIMVVLAASLVWVVLAFSTGCDGDGPFSTAPITSKDINQSSPCSGNGAVAGIPCLMDEVK